MRFLCNLMNHNLIGQRSLEDVIGIFGHQMRALGHDIVWDPKNNQVLTRDFGMNIVVEGFTPLMVQILSEQHQAGARFVCLATEEPTDKGFNHGTQVEMVQRQKMFPEAARFFEGIIHLVPGERVTRWYSQFAPSAYAELGYAPTLVRPSRTDIEPDFDFGFYGSLSDRRLKILKRLAKHIGTPKAVKIVGDFATQVDRDREMRRCRVLVQIRKFDEMGLVSSSRCNTALCLGRPVIAEPHLLSKPWDEIVQFASSIDAFYNAAIMMRTAWKGVHAAQFARFKERLTPEVCVGAALDAIGIPRANAAAAA